ncbi:polyribonucleotide nucleotidyltransferase [Lentimicrobium sp.]|jgi:polyribonucleotide nucleotidyltransferase|uniref:polyribonucleotide nucleotidyltransferase n=1 Tax=Lentimicrobium sp. TaxID=2034841 RepID=UPI0025F2E165|nr:polyribonucleotide nucleotidyltransferase [Lentimicrobium sp.]MCO5256505.1 polyribonucleotide nucleotidyltransferase [Lentimicrobium sp.]MCO5262995.1 polyribonucleotide nucleotidyltransferase [Lentimicrobium sp.]HOP12642.1 polyribonucleotide nucleotidyltransferase [Lentimicrobium sp.]HPF65243.1 polyribonucleotide nucleotidyltransferase [Lentimicrobium sp.]HPJ62763.1 polyribonucleotide nucleotidyltransferase [Lentimicrobium sp.]
MQGIVKTFDIGDGRSISIETGRLAKQADGAVVVKMGDTMLLATVVARKEAGENVDFMPLSVEYREKYAAAGRFPGGFFKREARPSDYEILIARLVDRALRPLFPDDFHAETQVIITLISADENILPDALAGLAASAALAVSDIPFNGPISEVRVARIDGKFVVNPHTKDIPLADLDIMVAASMDNIMMVEGEMKEVSEADMIEAIKFAHEHIKIQCRAQLELAAMVEKANPKRTYCHETNDAELKERLHAFAYQRIVDIASNPTAKHERSDAFAAIKEEFIATLDPEEAKEKEFMISRYYHDVEKEAVRNVILDKRQRLDGRKLDQIRPIWCEVDYLPAVHGSAIFTRGETQSLTTVTLGTKLDEQVIDGAVIEEKINFILHYNFPPFSTGEVKRIMGTSRREIGHGNLALRALKPMIPNGEENPYTIRVVSDILESNGSSSMATVCAGTMALMDAGVKIRKPVSGIAMGLISDTKTSRFAVLSDILGDEDHLGDMDFKVTGTVDGITACQMDIKVDGMPYEVLAQALEQAKAGRLHILGEMMKAISTPREDYKPHVPRIVKMTIPKEFIGAVIGPGGKVIQEMQRETGSTIVIEEVGDFGIIDIVSNNKESIEAVKDKIKRIVAIPEIGTVYHGVVKNITTFGAFVEVLPGKDGLLHISEIEHRRLDKVESALKVGDEIDVKLIDIDSKTGKLKLSRKVLLPKPEPDQK